MRVEALLEVLMPFVDFAELKARITFEQVISLLGLQMKRSNNQWRGVCPMCKSGGARALVITEGKGFYCFAKSAGGDQIALVAHIKDCSVKEAAQFLVNGTGTSRVQDTGRQVTVPKEETKTFAALDYLQSEHPAVEAVGFDLDFAEKNGIGFAPRGTMKGYVLIPFRDAGGQLLGYVGVQEAKLPADFTPNVISLDKKRA